MFVRMAMRPVAVPEKIMRVLVMLVVLMPMFVFERFMLVRMFMAFAQMQPDADGHQSACDPEREAGAFGKHKQR